MGLMQSKEIPTNQNEQRIDNQMTVVTMEESATESKRQKALTSKEDNKLKGLTRLITVANSRRKQTYNDNFDYHKESMGLLKQIFKKMDPSITRTTAIRSHGDLELSFKYDGSRELLLVKIIRARDLDAKDLRGKSADAYVKIVLLPSTNVDEIRKTKIVSRTLAPVFHEIFAFPVANNELNSRTIACQVWDHDMLSRDELIGETLVPLRSLDLETAPIYTGWYTLKAETDLDISGDLQLSLAYKLPSTLLLTVHRGNNLTNHYQEDAPNPFVKIQIPGVQKVYETEIKDGTVNPVWEQTFEFNVPPEDFKFRYIVLHAIDYDDAEKNESLGQVIVELKNFDPDTGFHGKFKLADLKNSDRLRTKCFQSTMGQEFREALVAHACAKYPKFLFQQQTGSKMIRVRNLKARSEAKLRIIDGVPMY